MFVKMVDSGNEIVFFERKDKYAI